MNIKFISEDSFFNQPFIILENKLPTITEHRAMLAKKYFALWKLFIKSKRKKKCLIDKEKLFEEKISIFIGHLKNNTLKLSLHEDNGKDSKSKFSKNAKRDSHGTVYENRIKAQRKMIENQKAVIEEQNNIIHELRSCTPAPVDLDPNYFRASDNDSSRSSIRLKSLPKTFEHPLMKRMKEREEERKTRRSLLDLRRVEKEKFLAEQLKREEEERKRIAVENRKIRIRERKERERIEKEKEIAKKKDEEFRKELRDRSKPLYHKLLCMKVFYKWKLHMMWLHDVQADLIHKFENNLLKKTISSWKDYAFKMKLRLRSAIIRMEERHIITVVWNRWNMEIDERKWRRELIQIWIDKETLRFLFRKWLNFASKSIAKKDYLFKSTSLFYERVLMTKTFRTWKKLPQVMYQTREKEKRLREWESKVKSVLPDYNVDRTVLFY